MSVSKRISLWLGAAIVLFGGAVYFGDKFMQENPLNYFGSMFEINPLGVDDFQQRGEGRAAYYAGIIPRVAEGMKGLFARMDEVQAREALLSSFEGEDGMINGLDEGFSLFRTRDHVAYFDQAVCEGRVSKGFGANAVHVISRYSGHRHEDYVRVAECMDAVIDEYTWGDIYAGLTLEQKTHAEKYYRYALWKGYVRDFRQEKIDPNYQPTPEQSRRTALFTQLGDLALVHEADAALIPPTGLAAAEKFIALGEAAMAQELLKQFDHCAITGCSTPEWEGTLFSIGLLRQPSSQDRILDYFRQDGPFVYELVRNTQYYTYGQSALRAGIKEIMRQKSIAVKGDDRSGPDPYHREYLGNLSLDPVLGEAYNPYAIRHKKLQKMIWN